MIIVCMTVAGSIPLILCCFLWLTLKEKINLTVAKGLLYVSMFFFLTPIQFVKYHLPQSVLWLEVARNIEDEFPLKVIAYENEFSISVHNENIWIPQYIILFLSIWMVIVLLFAIYQTIRYRRAIKKILSHSRPKKVCIDGIERDILVDGEIKTPCCLGYFKQHIIFPEEMIGHECMGMLYRHEYRHVKNHDSLFKLICLLIICLHFFNPFSFVLLIMYNLISESICDQYAVDGQGEYERKEYAKILIMLSSVSEKMPVVWRNNFSTSKIIMKRRVTIIMTPKKSSKLRKGFAAGVIAVSVLASVSTTLAYSPFQSSDETIAQDLVSGDFLTFETEEEINTDFSKSNTVFEGEDGSIWYIDEDAASPYAFCSHSFVNGTVKTHHKNSDGSCIVKAYKGRICTKCNYVEANELISTTTYAVCTHQ